MYMGIDWQDAICITFLVFSVISERHCMQFILNNVFNMVDI